MKLSASIIAIIFIFPKLTKSFVLSSASLLATPKTMTSQVLLPRDVTVRNFSICFDNDEIPPSFGTKDGPVKERNKEIIMKGFLCTILKPVVAATKRYFDSKCKVELINKSSLDPNFEAWRMINILLEDRFYKGMIFQNKLMESDISAAEKVVNARVGTWVTRKNRQFLMDRYGDVTPLFYKFYRVALYLEETRDVSNKHVKDSISEWKREGQPEGFLPKDNFSRQRVVRIYQIGTIVVVKILKKVEGSHTFIMTNVHLSRIIDYMKTAASLCVLTPDIEGFEPSLERVLKLLRYQAKVALKTPNGVGSVFKSARQILFLRGDKDMIMGSNAVNLYVSGLSGVKDLYGEKAADFLVGFTGNRKSAINLANIFRIIPHPDQDMEEVFESIEGFKDANKVGDDRIDRFEGLARKAVFESLTHQRIQVRAKAKDPNDSIASAFVRKVNATSTPTSSILSAGYTKWASVEFETVRGIFDQDKQEIPVSNKSSAPDAYMTEKEIDSIADIKSMKEFQAIRQRLKAVNDVLTRLKGDDDLEFKTARNRFRAVIRAHEEFEANYLVKGVKIDDIPSDDLAKFVKSNRDAAYTVCTEPKLGEVHKEVTRMFYMAQQALKMMTQVCERFTKKVISKSSGVSIVKDYRGRRKELEAMLSAYTGVAFDDEGKVIFISFDMSEFSKKFSQKLVRTLGKILSELSGEDWMKRIDIFFRAAVVYHNSRGFVGAKTGVLGGFEGFLNFLWTLAMKVVMDIATQSTGVTGVLAVYSDDGLLRLYIEGDRDTVRAKVLTIQRVFKSYGLIFHMDKTVASSEILEYLGVYGQKGMIIPNWIKESMSLGKRKKTKGLETVYDRISLWDSQTSAIIKANGPSYSPFLIKTIYTIFTLRRLHQRSPSEILAILTAVPYSAGGFRVSSISENSILSSIEGISEFAADMELLYEFYPEKVSTIVTRIYENLKTEKDAEKSILSGSLLQTYLPDTSGSGIARDLLEKANISGPGGRDPLTPPIIRRLLDSLKNAVNIPTKMIQNMIQTIPDMVDFNKNIAIMKSDVALKFLDKKEISIAQSKDTRRCRTSIEEWIEILNKETTVIPNFSGQGYITAIILKVYPNYSIRTPKESPRTALYVVKDNPMIISTMEITDRALITEQFYREPEARFLGAQLSPEFAAEGTATVKQRRYERFIAAAARLVATNISFINLYYIVANSFGLPCPSLPSSTVVSGHRSTTNFGNSAVNVFLQPPFHALITSRMSNDMWRTLENRDRADRTTYVESSRVATYLNILTSIDNSLMQEVGVTPVLYNIRDLVVNTENPVFFSAELPDGDLIDSTATKSFNTVIVEERAQFNALQGALTYSGYMEIIKDVPIVKAVITSLFEKWLYSCIMGTETSNRTPPHVPDPWKVQVYAESCVNVAFRLCKPNSKAVIQRSTSQLISASVDMGIEEVLRNPHAMQAFQNSINRFRSAYDELSIHLRRVGESMVKIEHDSRITEALGDYSFDSEIYTGALINYLKRKSVLGGSRIPTVVINTDSFADSKLSRNVKNAIKDAVDSSLNAHLEYASMEENWADSELNDATINFLLVLKNMIRPSGHRNTPFNKHMMSIQLVKFELYVTRCINRGVTRVNTSDLDGYRIPNLVGRSIVSQNAVIAGLTDKTTGEDMRKCLFSEGVPTWAVSRANYIIRKLRNSYSSASITEANIRHDRNFMTKLINYVLTTYNNIAKNSVDRIEVRHHRDAEKIGNATILNPVDEASLVIADINEGDLIAYEEDSTTLLENETFKDITTNLIIAHNTRWKTSGYLTENLLGNIIRPVGLIGNEVLEVRSIHQNPFTAIETTAAYTFSISGYNTPETATHNYLYINRLPGGMAVMGRTNERFYLFSVIPRGVVNHNTESINVPNYREGSNTAPPVYSLEVTGARMMSLVRTLGISPNTIRSAGEVGSIVVQQHYQRIVGSRGYVENEDVFLTAIAEVVRGSWSLDLGYRTLAMFGAWITNEGPITKAMYRAAHAYVFDLAQSDDNKDRAMLCRSASTIWSWVRMINLQAGPDIDTSEVLRIVRRVAMNMLTGGAPMAFFSSAPKTVDEVKRIRGTVTLDDVVRNSDIYVFEAPPRMEIGLIDYEEDDDSGDEW